MGGGGEGLSLEYTPTWVVAVVCSVIISISLVAERGLHSAGKYLKRRNQNPLYEALLKVKEELMLLGFISLLLTVFQKTITKMCVKESIMQRMLPCSSKHEDHGLKPSDIEHLELDSFSGITRRLLAAGAEAQLGYCAKKLLLAVGTKLQHINTQLAHVVAEKHVAVEGDLIVKPSDEHFWFGRPRFVLFLIHFILFQNAFEMAYFFWIWAQYGLDSCIMGKVRYILPRILIGMFIQFLCSYSTLPLYAIVTQMGSNFKKAIFIDRIHSGVSGSAKKATRKKAGVDGNGEVQLENKH